MFTSSPTGSPTLPITETDPAAISEMEPPADARLPAEFANNVGGVDLVAAGTAAARSKYDGGRRVRRDDRRGSAGALIDEKPARQAAGLR